MNMDGFVRFLDDCAQTNYGAITKIQLQADLTGQSVKVLRGDPFSGFIPTNDVKVVSKILCPLERTPVVACTGLNYKTHAREAGLELGPFPKIFFKPADTLNGPYDDVLVRSEVQEMMDYEGEFVVVMARDAKDVPANQALNYVLGFTIGNDVSARNFSLPDTSGKCFDGFAPIGPAIITTAAIPDPQKLSFTTKVNGIVRQTTSTEDMNWTVAEIIEHLSRGTTLRQGTVIMTGTPTGIGMFIKPKGFIQDGDFVSVELDGFGGLANKFVWQ
ncbi:uncharacterized protein Z518_01769 [Rhinocladiella mackenziei CBS 650.93]|uniref:Fumarylacetoacetase-like C-terminal domain-containing protein n=1 Tax=Rhinocladiella mackenziei CBS 650.93 TaxID=1442369 RepID=A0A0D2JMI6_9EURO|nr:uncharacterized protein Z518_01769 [Rhinocladiella mackenziei CBS 650.93]KIX10685.1 hypothetical protein Z518_01769 [Rhinocladiella mackenziei CBS 650.93]